MSTTFTVTDVLNAIRAASIQLDERKEEVNRLNVFPVPDGDTGTNMSLTIQSVVNNISQLPPDASVGDVRKAITTGALMGARGNSGVITSQILRGLCEGSIHATEFSAETVAAAMNRAVEVAFQAVRKPVEGTILTVLKDSATKANEEAKDDAPLEDDLNAIVKESYASVERTPDLLPVLKENGVVDSGAFGLAILFDAFVSALLGHSKTVGDELSISSQGLAPKVEIEHIQDWENANYRYCNEFLVESTKLNKNDALDFLATMGDCELCVGETPNFKVHVHSDHPDRVLAYFLERGQISEVYIHNMELQAEDRNEKLEEEKEEKHKNIGFVAVSAGSGIDKILKSLGVDEIVSGGQTMNPSTKNILDAVHKVNADSVIILPNNGNIIMAANTAVQLADVPCAVVPTKSITQAFAAMFAVDQNASLDANVSAMTDAFSDVKSGQVTHASRDSQDAYDNPIKKGDVIGIIDGSIEVVGSAIDKVVLSMLKKMGANDADTLTILAGEEYSDDDFQALIKEIEATYTDLEMDAHRGEQPLYPILMSVE